MASPSPAPAAPAGNSYNAYDCYHFYPSRGTTIVALTLFSVATILVLASTITTRRWIMLAGVGVGVLEIIGFANRWTILNDPTPSACFRAQWMVISAPIFLGSLQAEMLEVGLRSMQKMNPATPALRFQFSSKLGFAIQLVLHFLSAYCQSLGATLLGDSVAPSLSQTALIIGFVCYSIILLQNLMNVMHICSSADYGVAKSAILEQFFGIMYLVTVLLLIRAVFCIVEYSTGLYGLATHEQFFYSLDSLMVIASLFILGLYNYGFI